MTVNAIIMWGAIWACIMIIEGMFYPITWLAEFENEGEYDERVYLLMINLLKLGVVRNFLFLIGLCSGYIFYKCIKGTINLYFFKPKKRTTVGS